MSGLAAHKGELILVDNDSQDETENVVQEFISGHQSNILYIKERNHGLSFARNAGLSHASGDFFIFTDDDCYLAGNYFEVAEQTMMRENHIDFCGGRILLYDNSDAPYAIALQESYEEVPPHSFIPPGKFQGANLLIRRTVYVSIGEFDVNLGAGTNFRCEDIEYVARASFAGFRGAHIPELVVYHHHGRKMGHEIEQLKRQNAYARGAYYSLFILRGHLSYLWGWLRRSILRRRSLSRSWKPFITELRGMLDYTRSRFK